MPSQKDRERIAIELKTWLRSQSRFKTVRSLEEPTGIPYTSLRDYFSGDALPRGERLRRLANLTRIPGLLALASAESGVATSSKSTEVREHAGAVCRDVERLLQDLDYFKKASSAERTVLKSALAARDVGYLTSLLKAMYDEDQFQTWLYFTEYKPESR